MDNIVPCFPLPKASKTRCASQFGFPAACSASESSPAVRGSVAVEQGAGAAPGRRTSVTWVRRAVGSVRERMLTKEE